MRTTSLGATPSVTGHVAERASVSLARAAKRYVPATRGIPTIDPSLLNVRPEGSLPAARSQAKMPDPPRARRVIRKGIPTSEGGGTAGVDVIEGWLRIVTVNCFCVLFPAQVAGSF